MERTAVIIQMGTVALEIEKADSFNMLSITSLEYFSPHLLCYSQFAHIRHDAPILFVFRKVRFSAVLEVSAFLFFLC